MQNNLNNGAFQMSNFVSIQKSDKFNRKKVIGHLVI